ncbi:MAG: hypothetical protein KAU20_00965 [Nanoarchaeota archaeon]|nr:hypothetical protein [Nanoarchaeota archaeon]
MNKTALTIIISIILTVIIISLVNVGTSLFLEAPPDYRDFCGDIVRGSDESVDEEALDECNQQYKDAQKPYNQIRYYIFAGLGFILLIAGLFLAEPLLQITGLASGGILVTQGIVMNFENKLIVFISLLAILIIFGIIAYRIVKEKDNAGK